MYELRIVVIYPGKCSIKLRWKQTNIGNSIYLTYVWGVISIVATGLVMLVRFDAAACISLLFRTRYVLRELTFPHFF